MSFRVTSSHSGAEFEEDDFEDREYVRGLFEAEYAEAMSYEGHD